jgi:ferric-dicitrate binding protein FerR (iron transport regulator)
MAITEADIVAARTRAAEGGVPWDRAKAAKQAIEAQETKAALQAARLAAWERRRRRNRVLIAALGLLLAMLALLGWLLTRR